MLYVVGPVNSYTHIFFYFLKKIQFSVIIYIMEEDISNIDDIGIDLPDIPMPDENAQTQ